MIRIYFTREIRPLAYDLAPLLLAVRLRVLHHRPLGEAPAALLSGKPHHPQVADHAVLVDRPPAHIGSVIRHVQHLVAKVPVALIVGATEPPLDDLPLPLPGRTVRRGEVDRLRRE